MSCTSWPNPSAYPPIVAIPLAKPALHFYTGVYTIPPQGKPRLPEALDRLIQFYTETNKPDEVKKWQAERARYPKPEEKKY